MRRSAWEVDRCPDGSTASGDDRGRLCPGRSGLTYHQVTYDRKGSCDRKRLSCPICQLLRSWLGKPAETDECAGHLWVVGDRHGRRARRALRHRPLQVAHSTPPADRHRQAPSGSGSDAALTGRKGGALLSGAADPAGRQDRERSGERRGPARRRLRQGPVHVVRALRDPHHRAPPGPELRLAPEAPGGFDGGQRAASDGAAAATQERLGLRGGRRIRTPEVPRLRSRRTPMTARPLYTGQGRYSRLSSRSTA